MARTFNTLIIGAGNMGAFYDSPKDTSKILTHAHAFTAHKAFNLVGFYDIDAAKAKKAAKRWGVKGFKSISEAFRKNKIDVVSIAVPDDFHYSTLKEVVKYHPRLVFVEKPITASEHYASRIVKLYKKHRIALLVNYSRRFTPEFIKEKEKIKEGNYGNFVGGVGYYGKGILHNGGHMINTLRFLLGKVSLNEVIASEPDYYDNDPSVSAILNVSKKKFVMHHVNSSLYTIFEMDLLFEKARIRIVDSGFKIEKHKIKKSSVFNKYYDMVKDREIKTSLGLSCYEAVDNIKNFLNGRSDLLCEGTEALQDLKICIAISKKAKINKKILLFSHDLGGANMILPLVKPLQNRGYKVLLYGKRLSLDKYSEFKLKGVNIIKQTGETTPENIDRFIDRVAPDFIITGTSAMDMTERYLWRAASKHKVPSFALLDNWINYSIRFSSGDTTYFPTKICIVDDSARGKIFMDNLSGDMLLTTGNPYFEFLLKKNEETIKLNESSNRNLKNKNNLTILFVSEPISKFYKLNFNSEKYLGYTEKTIFENIYKSVTKTFKGNDTKIRILIKLHPQDNISGYNKILKKLKRNSKIKVVIVKKYKFSNWNLINSADIVCGMGSTLLTEAFLLRKPVLAVHIGLKKDYPSTFDKTGLMKSIRSQSELDRRFRKLIEKEPASKYNYGIIKNPIKQIISAMERILWQN